MTTKSKNSESFYIAKSYINNQGKSTSKIIRKLGTLSELSEMLHTDRDGVMAWAREQAKIETQKYKQETEVNCSPSRGQRKNIKFFRPAAKRCWPYFMQHSTTHISPSALTRLDCAVLVWYCSNGCIARSSGRVLAC